MKGYKFFIIGLFLLALPCGCSAKDTPPKSDPPGRKVILLGIDGLTEKVITRLLAQNKLKNIQYLRDHGSYGQIISIDPTASPPLWATIATGKKREEHGIINFEILNPEGRKIVANSSHRRTKALWNILSENEMRVGTIGYFTTWPVEKINGFMVSDASIYPIEKGYHPPETKVFMQGVLAPYIDYDLAHLNKFAKMSQEEQFKYFTPKMLKLLDQLGTSLINDYQGLKNKQRYSKIEWEQYRDFFKHHKNVEEVVFKAAFIDHIRFEYAKKMYKNDLDFFSLYLKGPDIVSHHNWGYYEPDSDTNPIDVKHYKDIIPNYYMFIDRVLGYFLKAADPDTVIILLSDHGFKKRSSTLLYDLNKILNTMGYLDYGPDHQIKKDKIFDAKDYWWRDVKHRKLHVNLNNIYPNRNNGEDDIKMKQLVAQLASIKVGNTGLFEQIDFYPKKRPGLYFIQVTINSDLYHKSFPRLEDATITINQKPYALSHYFEYSLNEGQHDTYDGVIHFMGAAIKPDNRIKKISILDVTPVILKIFDMPIGADMAGKIPPAIFKPEFLIQHPTQYIKSYDEINQPLKKTIPQKSPVDDKIKQQLRSLGYIQ